MTFVVFSITVIAWSLIMLRGVIVRSAAILLSSGAVLLAGIGSIALDVQRLVIAQRAQPSPLEVRVIHRGTWWQLVYSRGGVNFTNGE
jgi:hypothetical protein